MPTMDRRPSRLLRSVAISLLLAGCAATPAASPTRTSTPAPTLTPAPTSTALVIPAAAIEVVTVDGGPNVVALAAGRVWVELHRNNRLTSLEPDGLVEVDVGEVDVHCGIAAAGDEHVWGTSNPAGLVTRVDATTGEPDLTVEIEDVCGLGASADQVWVTTPGSAQVHRLDPETGETILDVDVLDGPFQAIPLGDIVYAAGEGAGGWIIALDPETGAELARATSPDVVMPDAFGLGAGSIWATGRMRSQLLRLEPSTLEVQATVDIGSEPSGLAVVGSSVWVAQLRGTLTRVDIATNTVTGRWQLPYRWLGWPVYGFDRLWMTSLEDDAVVAVDLEALGS